MTTGQQPAGAAVQVARDAYSETIRAVEIDFANDFAQIDGAYSKVTQYAGLTRDELLNIAKARRESRIEQARVTFEGAVNEVAGVSQPAAAQAQPVAAQQNTPTNPDEEGPNDPASS